LGRALGVKEQKVSRAGPGDGSERGLQTPVRLFFERMSWAGPGAGNNVTVQQGKTTATEQTGFNSFLLNYMQGLIYEF